MPTVLTVSLALHILVETAAALNFLLRPSATLAAPQPHSHGVIRQYALLLLSTNIIAAAVLCYAEHNALAKQIAGALALYHTGPLARAVARIRRGEQGHAMGGAWLHSVIHVMCLISLASSMLV